MRKIIKWIIPVCALFLASNANAKLYRSCTSSGQAYDVTTDANDNPVSWTPAGGCSGGPWVIELLARPIDEGDPYDIDITNSIAANFIPANQYAMTELDDLTSTELENAVSSVGIPTAIIDIGQLNTEQAEYFSLHGN